MTATNPTTDETARALLWRHGLPEDIVDGALCLHAQELAALQRKAVGETDDPVFYEGEAGWLIDLIDPTKAAAEPDDTDLTESDIDRMMAAGTPVQIVTAPPATYSAPELPANRVAILNTAAVSVPAPAPTDRTALRGRVAAALEREDAHNAGYDHGFCGSYGADEETDGFVDAVLAAVLPARDDRAAIEAAVLRKAADEYDAMADRNGAEDRAKHGEGSHSGYLQDEAVRDVASGLREMANEIEAAAVSGPGRVADETQAEDPARIDRLRPEFTDHASVESIDAQLRRARSQERRWHQRTEWLIGLRKARVEQKARGEWPVVVSQPDGEA